MRLNVVNVLNEIANEEHSQVLLEEMDKHSRELGNGYRNLYEIYVQLLEQANRQATEMCRFMAKHPDTYKKADFERWGVQEPMSFDNYVSGMLANVNIVY